MFIIEKIHISVKDVIFTTIKSYLLLILSVLLFPFAIVFIPSFLIELGIRKGTLENILANVMLAFLVTFSFGGRIGVAFFLVHSLVSIFMERMVRDKLLPNQTIYFLTAGLSAFLYLTNYLLERIHRIDVTEWLKMHLQTTVTYMMKTMQSLNLAQNTLQDIHEMFSAFSQYLIILLPAFVIGCSFLYSLINYYMAIHLLQKKQILDTTIAFNQFQLPRSFALAFILSFITVYILKNMGFSYTEEFAYNLEFLFSMIFMINGISVVDYKFRNWHIAARVILPTIAILLFSFNIIYAIIGFADAVFHFRKRSFLQ